MRVVQVLPDSGASAAGLRSGDRILSVAGRPVDTIDALRARLGDFTPGETVTVVIRRGDERHELRVRLSSPTDRVQRPFVPAGEQPRSADVPDDAFLELFAQLPDDARARFLDLVAGFVAERLAERTGRLGSGRAMQRSSRRGGAHRHSSDASPRSTTAPLARSRSR